MTNDTTSETTGRISGLLSRLRSDAGDMMMESLATMVIVAITISSFSLGFISMNQAQRSMSANDIASQAARGVIEHAKSTDYSALGFTTADPGYRASATIPNVGTVNNDATISAETAGTIPDRIRPLTESSVRNTPLTIRTDIGNYQSGKRVVVSVSYKVNGKAKTKVSTAYLVADPSTYSGAGRIAAPNYDNITSWYGG